MLFFNLKIEPEIYNGQDKNENNSVYHTGNS